MTEHDCSKCAIARVCTRHPKVDKTGVFGVICRGDGDPVVRKKWLAKWDTQEYGRPLAEPVLPLKKSRLRGAGDLLALAIKYATFGRVRPCGGCNKRIAWLNEKLPLPHWGDNTNMTWCYGVTTVRERLIDGTLQKTLASLDAAGFTGPKLFVDGDCSDFAHLPHGLTCRGEPVKPYGNWLLAILELYIRNPHADRYAMFQDDIIVCRGLKEYLERAPYPDKGYLNLFTSPDNRIELIARTRNDTQRSHQGFYPSNQKGRGALALVFSREALVTLLTQWKTYARIQNRDTEGEMLPRGERQVDGGIVDAMKAAGYAEFVHNPSLVQHVGEQSTIGHNWQPKSTNFPGEDWDCRTLLGGGT